MTGSHSGFKRLRHLGVGAAILIAAGFLLNRCVVDVGSRRSGAKFDVAVVDPPPVSPPASRAGSAAIVAPTSLADVERDVPGSSTDDDARIVWAWVFHGSEPISAQRAVVEIEKNGSRIATATTGNDGLAVVQFSGIDPTIGVFPAAVASVAQAGLVSSPSTISWADDGRTGTVTLVLRDAMRIHGRVVDATGRPKPGAEVYVSADPWRRAGTTHSELMDAGDATARGICRSDGTFSILTRRGPGGFAAARGANGVLGPRVQFTSSRATVDLELGDVLLPEHAALWRIRVRDEQGRAVKGALARFTAQELPDVEALSGFDVDEYSVVAGEDGVVSLAFSCRTEPVVLGVGAPGLRASGLALDCTQPGEFEFDVALGWRPRARVRVLGVDPQELAAAGVRLRPRPSSGGPTLGSECVVTDARTGESRVVNRAGIVAAPNFLDYSLLHADAECGADGTFSLWYPSDGDHEVELISRHGRIVRAPVVAGGPDAPVSDVSMPPGRFVRVRWLRSSGEAGTSDRGPSTAAEAVWAHGGEALATMLSSGLPVLAAARGGAQDAAPSDIFWMPGGVDRAAFGLVESGSSGAPRIVRTDGVLETRREGVVEVVDVPAASDAPGTGNRVAVQVLLPGSRTCSGAVALEVRRLDADGSDAGVRTFVTDGRGRIDLSLSRGTYVVSLAEESVPYSPPRVTIDVPSSSGQVPIVLEFGRRP